MPKTRFVAGSNWPRSTCFYLFSLSTLPKMFRKMSAWCASNISDGLRRMEWIPQPPALTPVNRTTLLIVILHALLPTINQLSNIKPSAIVSYYLELIYGWFYTRKAHWPFALRALTSLSRCSGVFTSIAQNVPAPRALLNCSGNCDWSLVRPSRSFLPTTRTLAIKSFSLISLTSCSSNRIFDGSPSQVLKILPPYRWHQYFN